MARKARMGRNLDALLGGARQGVASRPASDAAPGKGGSSAESEAAAGTRSPTPESIDVPSGQADAGSVQSASLPAGPPRADHVAADDVADVRQQSGDRLRMLGVDQLRRGVYQPRRHFDEQLLQELADSLKAQGMIQPIVARPSGGAYEIIAGERRWRAAQLAGLGEVPVIVRELDDRSVAAVSLIENIQRKDLNPLEEAEALSRLCDEFGMTHQAVADSVGRSRVSVTNLLRLLELDDVVKQAIDRVEIDMGHARALLGAPAKAQAGLVRRTVDEALTVRSLERLIKELKDGPKPASPAPSTDPDIEVLRRGLGERLGAPVQIHHRRGGAGKLEIAYTSVAELEGILAHIR